MNNRDTKSLDALRFVTEAYQKLGEDLSLHWRDVQTLRTRAQHEKLPFFTSTLPRLGKSFDQALGSGIFIIPDGFATQRNTKLPQFLGSFFRKVFFADGRIKEDACPVAVMAIRQICFFAYKAKAKYSDSKEQAVIDNFVAVEKEIAEYSPDSVDPILEIGALLVYDLFKDADSELIFEKCKHGPGVTSNVNTLDKYEHQLNFGVNSVKHYGRNFFFNEDDAFTRLNRYPVHSHSSLISSLNRESNCAKVILVPKDSRGPRLISCEPCENQYSQQGIMSYMVDRLEGHPYTKGHVNFRDQSINADLAVLASSTQEYSTLDLKDASDRVSKVLVERLFGKTPLLALLMNTRSEFTQLPRSSRDLDAYLATLGSNDSFNLKDAKEALLNVPSPQKVKLSKFAPMGSAVCFPVLATCVWSIIVSGLIGLGLTPKLAFESVYIYGDDIVIKTDYANYCILLLERYALKVNREKCFINSPFAESCGTDAFKGHNVTPIRLRSLPECSFDQMQKMDPSFLVSTIETGNLCRKSGLTRLGGYLLGISQLSLGPLPYGFQFSPFLCIWANPVEKTQVMNLNRQRLKLRSSLAKSGRKYISAKCWVIRPVNEVNEKTTPYGHFSRIWRTIGSGLEIAFGKFDLPKKFNLLQRKVDIEDQTDYPSSTWTPDYFRFTI